MNPVFSAMRVLFLHRHPTHTKDSRGGLVSVFRELPRALSILGVDVLLYHENRETRETNCAAPHGTLLPDGIKLLTGPFPAPRWFSTTATLRPLMTLCETEKIDLLHAHGAYRSGWLAMQLGKRLGIPYVVTSHSDILPDSSKRMRRAPVRRRCQQIFQRAAGLTHLAPHMAEIAHQIHDTRNKSALIGNGIDVAAWQASAQLTEKNYLLAMGRLVPEKGFDILIEAFVRAKQHGCKASLVIAGSGTAATSLHQQASKTGVPVLFCSPENREVLDSLPAQHIIFTGHLDDARKQKMTGESLAVLFPTQPEKWQEPFGLVALEAMAAGKPLIASKMPAITHLQNSGLDVLPVKAGDADAWAAAILDICEDQEKRQRMRKNNLAAVSQFCWSVIANQYADFYQACLDNFQNTGR